MRAIHRAIHQEIDEAFLNAYKEHNGRTPRSWSVTDTEALSALLESIGSVALVNFDEDPDQLFRALIQVAATSAAWAERIGVKGDHPGGVPVAEFSSRSFETGSDEVTTEVHDITSIEREAA